MAAEDEYDTAPGNKETVSNSASKDQGVTKKRGQLFQKGNRFGRGRAQGSRNNATIALQSLLDGEGELLVRKAVTRAMEGDSTALRLCIERLIPPARERTVEIDLPTLNTASDLVAGISRVMNAIAEGQLTPSEGERIAALLDAQRRAIETADLERRIETLESRNVEQQSS